MNSRLIHFIGGAAGPWQISSMRAVAGEPLMPTSHLQLGPPAALAGNSGTWQLTGVMSNVRYAEKAERAALASVQAPLGRAEATCAALIPLRKSEAWWALAQDERRALFEQQSHHTQTRLAYLPAVARQLYHSRDLGEPFDFLTWFEYAPADEARFEELLTRLRSTPEWQYVDREIDIRLVRC